MTLGEKIKNLRDDKKLTHIELAKAINCSVGAVSLWENNLRTPNAHFLSVLARYFEVSADYLLAIED